jgi:drug/metabolite transporter (DMT)-like permease
MTRTLDHLYILAMILFTAYSQVVMRWQVSLAGALPPTTIGKIGFVTSLLLNPWVLTGIAASFLAGVAWMLALSKFELSYAYPFVSLIYILVLASGVLLFRDSLTAGKALGTAVIVAGILIVAKAG